jgi:hypothetical protein
MSNIYKYIYPYSYICKYYIYIYICVYIIFTNVAASRRTQHGGPRLGHLSYRWCPSRDSSRVSSKCKCRAMEHCVLQVGSRRLGPVFRHVCRWHQVSTRALCRGVQRDEVKGELQQTRKNSLKLVRCRSLPSVEVQLYVSREGRTLDVRTAEQFCRVSFVSFLRKS